MAASTRGTAIPRPPQPLTRSGSYTPQSTAVIHRRIGPYSSAPGQPDMLRGPLVQPGQVAPRAAADRRSDVGKLRGSREDLRARRHCIRRAGRCAAPALSASVEATRQRGGMPDGRAERGGRHRVTRGSFAVGALSFSDDDGRGAPGDSFEEIGSSDGYGNRDRIALRRCGHRW
jgi:hypothetical protein